LRKKISNLLENEIPLLLNIFPDINLTKFSKNRCDNLNTNLSKNSKKRGTVLEQRKFERYEGLEGPNHCPIAITAEANEKTHDFSHHDNSRNSAGRGIRTFGLQRGVLIKLLHNKLKNKMIIV
jgi:hypothetical protein